MWFKQLCPAAVVLIALSAGCGSLQRPAIRDVHMRITGLDWQGVSLAFDVAVDNPYPIALNSPKITYALDLEEHEFAKSEAPISTDIPARSVGKATLPIRLDYVEVWKSVAALAEAPEVRYRLRAEILLAAMGQSHEVPIKHEGTVPVLRMPTFTPGKVSFTDVSLSGAAVELPIQVSNPNIFALDLRELGWELSLGEAQVGSLSATSLEPIAARGTGTIMLTGRITAGGALRRVMAGSGLGPIKLGHTGAIQTPYGAVPIGG